jgi:hypothetical protein
MLYRIALCRKGRNLMSYPLRLLFRLARTQNRLAPEAFFAPYARPMIKKSFRAAF